MRVEWSLDQAFYLLRLIALIAPWFAPKSREPFLFTSSYCTWFVICVQGLLPAFVLSALHLTRVLVKLAASQGFDSKSAIKWCAWSCAGGHRFSLLYRHARDVSTHASNLSQTGPSKRPWINPLGQPSSTNGLQWMFPTHFFPLWLMQLNLCVLDLVERLVDWQQAVLLKRLFEQLDLESSWYALRRCLCLVVKYVREPRNWFCLTQWGWGQGLCDRSHELPFKLPMKRHNSCQVTGDLAQIVTHLNVAVLGGQDLQFRLKSSFHSRFQSGCSLRSLYLLQYVLHVRIEGTCDANRLQEPLGILRRIL